MTPSPCRGLPPASVPLARAARCRLFRREVACGHCAQRGGPLRAAEVLVVSLNGTVAGSISRRPMRAGGTRSPEPPPTSGAAHRRQGLHPSPVEGRLRRRGIGLQTPLRKNMADGRHPGFARMPVKVRQMAKTVIAQPAQRFSLRAHTGAGPLALHQLGRAKNARPYCGRLPQPVCRTAATPVRGTASTMKRRT